LRLWSGKTNPIMELEKLETHHCRLSDKHGEYSTSHQHRLARTMIVHRSDCRAEATCSERARRRIGRRRGEQGWSAECRPEELWNHAPEPHSSHRRAEQPRIIGTMIEHARTMSGSLNFTARSLGVNHQIHGDYPKPCADEHFGE
jgi:hypothetical protein